jgi:hypothetical protein
MHGHVVGFQPYWHSYKGTVALGEPGGPRVNNLAYRRSRFRSRYPHFRL